MRLPLVSIVLSSVSAAVCAQSANERVIGAESCFQLARAAAQTCYDPRIGATESFDCEKARKSLSQCLEHLPPDTSAPSAASKAPTGIVLPGEPTGTVSSEKPSAPVSPGEPSGALPQEAPSPPVLLDKPRSTVSPEMPAKTVDSPANRPDANWVISETTSPVDFSPLFTAAIRSSSGVQDAPNTLVIRCRGLRTELMVRTEGTWHPSRASEVQVDYQIDAHSNVRLKWMASVDGKTASYRGDTVELLRSLPEGARLKINVFDSQGSGHEATFQLTGVDAIRKKIGSLCKWPPAANRVSLGKR